jgi:hypothetical protein
MGEPKIESGRTPVEKRLHDASATVIGPTDAAPDDLVALSLVLHRLESNLAGFWNAAGCCEREFSRRTAQAYAMFAGDSESAQLVLRQMAEAEQRISAVRAKILGKGNEDAN